LCTSANPLIHNSAWLREAGYYYPGFDSKAGAAQLLHAVRHHDAQIDDYRARSKRVIDAVDPFNVDNIAGYARLLLDLVGGDAGFRADGAKKVAA